MLSTGICRWLFLLISLSTWTKLTDSKEMRIVCYYTNWSVYRPGQAKFSPQNINPYLCTHLVYAFGGFTKENTLKPFDKYQDIEKGGYAKFTGLKTYNKNLKTLIAIGGWNEGSSRFSPMVASADRRKELVKNTIKFLRQNHFDGLDLDWEYPTFRDGGKNRDRDNYAQLVQELREEFERESEKTGRPRLLLTMAVPAGIEYINKGYDVPKLTKYLDWMNILSYDYHSAFEPAVNHHAPLYSLEEDNEYNYDAELNIDYTIKHYLKLGADPNKLVLGIPTYGRSYTLFNPDAFEIGSPADGPGDMGEATRENGYLAYYEICENVKNQDWEVDEPNSNAMGPIAFKENQWVGYDDENIVRKKAEYVAENSLGGIMFWAIDNDDFRGNCHGKPYPLIEAGKEALLNAYGLTEENLISPPSKPTKSSKQKSRTRTSKTTTTTTTEQPEENSISSVTSRRRRIKPKTRDEEKNSASSAKRRKDSSRKSEVTSTYSSLKVITPAYTTPAPPATPDTGGVFKCEDEGFYPHPKDCKKYFWCLGGPGDTGIVAHQFTCPAGLYFNKAADSCDYSQNVLCNKKLQKATTTTQKIETSSTETTTSPKPTPNSIFTTSRTPLKISKSTINFRTTTTTTTTEAYEDEYEDEDDEDVPNKKEEAEEDPRVIKELIDLIKKAGGIEELEKQLQFGKDGSPSTSSVDSTTPSVISKSLYERVLSKTSKNNLNALKKASLNRNSGGPQGSGTQESKEKNVDRGRPQYKTLTRQRPTTESPSAAKELDTKEEAQVEAKEKKLFRTKSTLEYVNIRRPKASTTTEANDDDNFSRNKILGELDEEEDEDGDDDDDEDTEDVPKKSNVPQYVNIRRPRPSTTETSASSSKYTSIRRSTSSPAEAEPADDHDIEEDKGDEEDKKYKTIQRSTTTEPSNNSEESTGLRYQTIRRGTTTTPTSVSKGEEETIRVRSTTVSSATPETTDPKYPSIRRSTTASPVEKVESTAKYQTVNRDRTTQPTLSSSEITKSPEYPEEQAGRITETEQSSTTLFEDSISNNNIITTENIISSTQKEKTESNSDVSSNTSNATRSDSLSETSEAETIKKRPVLFQPRPFSIGTSTGKSTTSESTTVTSKVSQTNLRYRLKSNSTTESPNSSTLRTRNRIRFSNVNKNLNEDTEQEEKYERTEENKPIRARKRPLVVTEIPLEANEDYIRKYRPAELADLSSLTAVDLNLRGGEFVSNNRRRRPVTTTPSLATTEKPLQDSEKTGSRTLTLARKAINATAFGKSRRIATISDDQLNASSDQTSTTRKIIRGFRSTTPIAVIEVSTPTTEKNTRVSPRTRKIIRRFRPSSTEATSTTEEILISSTTPSTQRLQRKRIPLFRSRQNKNTVTPATAVTEKTELTEKNLPSSESPLLKLFKTRSRFDISRNDTTNLKKEEDDDGDDESSNEHTDVLNGEEGENIKLSESNIRESSKINAFDFDEKPGKRKVSKSKEVFDIQIPNETMKDTLPETTTDISNSQSQKMVGTEPTRIIRTRKIIRKLGTTSTTEPSTSTTAATLESNKNVGKKRKILRRLRPTIENDLEDKNKQILNKKYRFEELTSTKPPPEEEITRKVFRPSFARTTEKILLREEKEKFEPNKFRIFRPTTDGYLTASSPEYNSYTKPTSTYFDSDNDDNDDYEENSNEEYDDQDEDDENDDINLTEDDIPKYTIYTTSSIERTHKFESNTNFNDEEEEDPEKNMKANKSISALILKTALNSRKESKTILDDVNGEELKEEQEPKNKEENNEDSTTTVVKVNHLLQPQNKRPSFTKQRLTLGTEEVKNKSQQDLLKTQRNPNELLSTEQTMDSSTTPLFEMHPTKVTEVTEKDNNSSFLPVTETTEQVDVTTLIINNETEENDTTNDIIFTTTEELKETSTNHLTDKPIEISHPDERDETTEDIIPTTTDTIVTTQTTDEITKPTISNLTESTTEYHRRSTLRSVKDRPKLGFIRRTSESSRLSSTTEPTKKTFTRTFGKSRPSFLSTPKPTIKQQSPLPLNKLLYKYSTTQKNTFDSKEVEEEDDELNDEDEEDSESKNEEVPNKKVKPIFSRSSTTPRTFNEPVSFTKSNKPKFSKTFGSTPSTIEDVVPLDVDTEAVRNRNKNLFSKRKMNTPVILSSTTPVSNLPTEQPETTTSNSIDSTDPNLTTLHHIFAEIDDADTTTESMNSSTSANPGKVERLIEVNRIVEVKTKQAKIKNHTGLVEEDTKVEITPTVDKIGEISRITLIKIVDGNREAIIKDPESNEIPTSLETTTHVNVPTEVAKVEEIPASKVMQNVSLKNFQFDIKMQDRERDGQRDDRKFEIFGESKVINSKEQVNPSGKPEIIDGISHINVVTPKPLQVTEASTISLQGLFQTERPHLNPNFASTDEVLETGRSEFVNVRVLDQDTGINLNNGLRGSTNFIPVRLLHQNDEESTIKAHVMEISPKPNSRTIKIVPIRVEMSRNIANIKLTSKERGVKA